MAKGFFRRNRSQKLEIFVRFRYARQNIKMKKSKHLLLSIAITPFILVVRAYYFLNNIDTKDEQ